jgi:hypothetical protein
MCDNMVVSDGHYTESSNCLVCNEAKGRRALTTLISYLEKGKRALDTHISHRKQREMCYIGARLPFT